MRILHTGKNDGSHLTRTVKCLRKNGIDAIGISFYHSNIVDYGGIYKYKKIEFIKYYVRFFIEALKADLVHLWSFQVPFIVLFLKLIRKPFLIEWTGGDIRNPELMEYSYSSNEYVMGNKEKSLRNQRPFRKTINIVSSPILGSHLTNPIIRYVPHRIDLDEFEFNPTVHKPIRI